MAADQPPSPVEQGSVVASRARRVQHIYAQRHAQPSDDLGGCHHAAAHAVALPELLRQGREEWVCGCVRGYGGGYFMNPTRCTACRSTKLSSCASHLSEPRRLPNNNTNPPAAPAWSRSRAAAPRSPAPCPAPPAPRWLGAPRALAECTQTAHSRPPLCAPPLGCRPAVRHAARRWRG